MKKAVGLIIGILMMVAILPQMAFADTDGYYTYELYEDNGLKAKITDVDTAITGEVVVPAMLGGSPVCVIDDYAFDECMALTHITIPDGVTTIGREAFSNTGLTSVTIPDTVEVIGDYAFTGSTNLESVTIGNGVTTIGREAFSNTGLTSVTIPDTVTILGNEIFKGCTNLESVIIGSGVTTISWGAFSNTGLTSVTIPDTVEVIGDYAFKESTNLESVTIGNEVTTIGRKAFSNTGLTSVTIPDTVEVIGDYAFKGSTNLESVTMGNGVTTIGREAFSNTGLTNVTIPNMVTTLTNEIFEDCVNLESITIPDTVEVIGDYAFKGCTNLESVIIGNGVTTIGKEAFSNTGLTSVTIPDTVEVIGDYAFKGCTNLESVTIGNGVTTIGREAFSNTSLTTVNYSGTCIQWAAIAVGGDNDTLINTLGISLHEFDADPTDMSCNVEGCGYICPTYTVIFDANDGTVAPASKPTNRFGKIATLPTPARKGYNFMGWKASDGSDVTIDTVYSEDTEITAQWQRRSSGGGGGGGSYKYTVTFETDGGSKIEKIYVYFNERVDEPNAPTKDGFVFDGWYTEKGLIEEYDFSSKIRKNITLYAKWVELEPDIDNGLKWNPFIDVKEKHWFFDEVKHVYEEGLMNGTSSTLFSPNDNVTRGMFVTVLYRMEEEPETTSSAFKDVPSGAYFADAVDWANANGIVNGISDTEFAPNANITREQIATILYRYAQFKEYDVSVGEDTNILSYTDFDKISEWAISALQWTCGEGITGGKSEGVLNPLGTATRAEMAAMLSRIPR